MLWFRAGLNLLNSRWWWYFLSLIQLVCNQWCIKNVNIFVEMPQEQDLWFRNFVEPPESKAKWTTNFNSWHPITLWHGSSLWKFIWPSLQNSRFLCFIGFHPILRWIRVQKSNTMCRLCIYFVRNNLVWSACTIYAWGGCFILKCIVFKAIFSSDNVIRFTTTVFSAKKWYTTVRKQLRKVLCPLHPTNQAHLGPRGLGGGSKCQNMLFFSQSGFLISW